MLSEFDINSKKAALFLIEEFEESRDFKTVFSVFLQTIPTLVTTCIKIKVRGRDCRKDIYQACL